MSETISPDLIGTLLRTIQAEQRTLRTENELTRKELCRLAGSMVTRDLLGEVLNVLVDRIANFEALTETRLDRFENAVNIKLDGLAAQLTRIEDGKS